MLVVQKRLVELQHWSKISPERKYLSCLRLFLLTLIFGRLLLSLVRKLIWGGSWRGHLDRAIWNTSWLLSSLARKGTSRTVGGHLIFLFFFFSYAASNISEYCKTWERNCLISCKLLLVRSSLLIFVAGEKLWRWVAPFQVNTMIHSPEQGNRMRISSLHGGGGMETSKKIISIARPFT